MTQFTEETQQTQMLSVNSLHIQETVFTINTLYSTVWKVMVKTDADIIPAALIYVTVSVSKTESPVSPRVKGFGRKLCS